MQIVLLILYVYLKIVCNMCTNPVRILNPSYQKAVYSYVEGQISETDPRLRIADKYIAVPCGKCPECRLSYSRDLIQRAQIESLTSYVYMVTLTYDDEHIPHVSFTSYRRFRKPGKRHYTCDPDKPLDIYYADLKHIQDMFKRLRNLPVFQERGLRYFACCEFGSERFRPHHHLMLFVSRLDTDDELTPHKILNKLLVNIRKFYGKNIGTRKNPVYEPYFTYAWRFRHGHVEENYRVEYVQTLDDQGQPIEKSDHSRGCAAVTSYIVGYMQKIDRFDQKLREVLAHGYFPDPVVRRRIRSLLCSQVHYSKHFGFGFDTSTGARIYPSPANLSISETQYNVYNLLKPYLDPDHNINALPLDLQSKVENYASTVTSPFYNVDDDICGTWAFVSVTGLSKFREWISSLEWHKYFLFVLSMWYFPKFRQSFFCTHDLDVESFELNWFPQSYDDSYKSSVAYKAIRSMIDKGLRARQPFLSFVYVDRNGQTQYRGLSSYYRRYCTTPADQLAMFDSICVRDMTEYISYMSCFESPPGRARECILLSEHNTESGRPDDESLIFSKNSLFYSSKLSIFALTGQDLLSLV